jgi:hypothetical protein
MNDIVEIGIPCTPANETSLDCLGTVQKVGINANGGMGGCFQSVIGKVSYFLDEGHIKVKLSESNREIMAMSRWISTIEDVTLYRQTHKHGNNVVSNPKITYFYTLGDVRLKQSDKYMNDHSKPKNPFVWVIAKACC